MEVKASSQGVGQSASNYVQKEVEKKAEPNVKKKDGDVAGVYEPSTKEETKTHMYDKATVDKLIADAEKKTQEFYNLIQKSLGQQGKTSVIANMGDMLKSFYDVDSNVTDVKRMIMGLNPDQETVDQAKKDVADGGYWSPEETAGRMIAFAKALSGGDSSQLDKLEKAFEDGFKAAEKAWGDKLPDISKKTYDLVKAGFEDLRKGE